MAADVYTIPTINTKGNFKFKPPYNVKEYESEIFTVDAIRSIKDMIASGEDPYKGVYQPIGMSEADYNNDSENKVPIVVLKGSNHRFLYVPANRITTIPLVEGREYQQMALAVNMGYLPYDYDISTLSNDIIEAVYNITGIKSTVELVRTSGVLKVDYTKHDTFMKLLENKKSVTKSWKTKYLELEEKYNALKILIQQLESTILNTNPEANGDYEMSDERFDKRDNRNALQD